LRWDDAGGDFVYRDRERKRDEKPPPVSVSKENAEPSACGRLGVAGSSFIQGWSGLVLYVCAYHCLNWSSVG
jgi:hypothetical protein